jgi:cysteinyl-tRNA synthetase
VTFRLYDSATRSIRPLEPLRPGEVSIYHCGLTVQSAPHLGHIRKEVVFDVLRRWLAASGLRVTVVANVTDIDDKILAKSAEAGVPWFAHAYRFERSSTPPTPPRWVRAAHLRAPRRGPIPEMVELSRNCCRVAMPAWPTTVRATCISTSALAVLRGCRISASTTCGARRGRADPRGKRDPATSPSEGVEGHRAAHRVVAGALGPWPARLAPGVLGHGGQVPR